MPYNVVILAGGFGSRLAPITDDIPKPLVPVCGIPVLERLTAHLKANGFDAALLTVCALPEAFRAYHDPNLSFEIRESKLPRGSAGCLLEIADELADTVLILSGDTVTDADLRLAFDAHVRERRKATVLLTRTDSPGEFGTVGLASDFRIVGFTEKPSWRDTLSDLVSTGIYILDKQTLLSHIPAGVCWEFGRDLFPALLREGVPVYGEPISGRWWDIGTPASFYACSMQLSGESNILGSECVLSEKSSVARSILFDRVKIGASRVEGSILCDDVRVGDGCLVPAGCVIGKGTVLEDGASLAPGVKLKGGLVVSPGAVVDRFRMSGLSQGYFGDEQIAGKRTDYDAVFCLRLGQALKPENAPLRLGILHSSSPSAKLCADLVALGARDAGAKVWQFGEAFPAVTSFAARAFDLDAAVFVGTGDSVDGIRFRFADRLGLPLTRDHQRNIEKRINSGSLPHCVSPSDPVIPDGEDKILCRYCHFLQEQVGGLHGVSFAVSRRDEAGEFLYSNGLALGADVSYSLSGDSFTVSPDGRRAGAVSAGGKELTYWHLVLIAASESPEARLGLPASAPDVVVRTLEKIGKEVLLFNDVSDGDARRASLRLPYLGDGVLLCLVVMSCLRDRNLTLDGAYAALPVFALKKKLLPVEPASAAADRRASRIAAIASSRYGFPSRRVSPARVFWKSGCVSFTPNASGGFTLLAEAPDLASAEELCARAERLL